MAPRQAYAAKDFRTRLFAIRTRRERNPSSAIVLVKLADTYARMGPDPEAIEYFTRALKLDRGNSTASQGSPPRGSGWPSLAAAEAAEPPPKVVDEAGGGERYNGGREDINDRKYAESLPILDEALQKKPGYGVALVARGSAQWASCSMRCRRGLHRCAAADRCRFRRSSDFARSVSGPGPIGQSADFYRSMPRAPRRTYSRNCGITLRAMRRLSQFLNLSRNVSRNRLRRRKRWLAAARGLCLRAQPEPHPMPNKENPALVAPPTPVGLRSRGSRRQRLPQRKTPREVAVRRSSTRAGRPSRIRWRRGKSSRVRRARHTPAAAVPPPEHGLVTRDSASCPGRTAMRAWWAWCAIPPPVRGIGTFPSSRSSSIRGLGRRAPSSSSGRRNASGELVRETTFSWKRAVGTSASCLRAPRSAPSFGPWSERRPPGCGRAPSDFPPDLAFRPARGVLSQLVPRSVDRPAAFPPDARQLGGAAPRGLERRLQPRMFSGSSVGGPFGSSPANKLPWS